MLKKIYSFIFILVAALLLAPVAMAEDTAVFTLSKSRSSLGDTVTATLTFSSTTNDIADIQGNITYNDKVLEFADSDYVTVAGGGNLTFRAFTDTGADSSFSMTFTFKTIGEGDGFIRLINCRITDNMQNGVRSPSAETSVEVTQTLDTTTTTTTAKPEETTTTAKEPEEAPEDTTTSGKEDEKETTTTASAAEGNDEDEIPEGKLKSLTLSTGYLSPAFSYDVTEYEIQVAPDCTWLEITGETSREGEYIWYTGDENVYDGIITRTITVKDSAGNETVYTFRISRMTAEEQERIENEQPAVTETPEEAAESKTSTTRKLSLEKNSPTLKKTIAAVGIVVIIVLVIIIALASSKSGGKGKRKRKIKKSK